MIRIMFVCHGNMDIFSRSPRYSVEKEYGRNEFTMYLQKSCDGSFSAKSRYVKAPLLMGWDVSDGVFLLLKSTFSGELHFFLHFD